MSEQIGAQRVGAPAVPADGTGTATVAQTIGNKGDAVSTGVATGADTIVAYLKQLVNNAILAGTLGPLSQYRATTTTKNSSVTVHALDALGATKRNVVWEFWLEADAAATFTPALYKTSLAAPTVFVVEGIPSISTIATPAADGRYRYSCGDVPEELQMEFRVAQDNAGDATTPIRSVVTHD